MQGGEIEAVSWGRFFLASATVIGLLSLLAWGLKNLVARGWITPRSTNDRLKFVSALTLDARHRLVLTQCDDKEYLLLLGPTSEIVLSSTPIAPSCDISTKNNA